MLDSFYGARRSGPEAEPGRDRWQTYYWFADDSAEFLAYYAAYRDKIRDYYQQHAAGELPCVEFNRVMDLSHSTYFARADVTAYYHDRLKHLWPERRRRLGLNLGDERDARYEWGSSSPTCRRERTIQGTADFNGDGMGDILLRNASSGNVPIWE